MGRIGFPIPSIHQASNKRRSMEQDLIDYSINSLYSLTCKYSFVGKHVSLFLSILAFYFQFFFRSIVRVKPFWFKTTLNTLKDYYIMLFFYSTAFWFSLYLVQFTFPVNLTFFETHEVSIWCFYVYRTVFNEESLTQVKLQVNMKMN